MMSHIWEWSTFAISGNDLFSAYIEGSLSVWILLLTTNI